MTKTKRQTIRPTDRQPNRERGRERGGGVVEREKEEIERGGRKGEGDKKTYVRINTNEFMHTKHTHKHTRNDTDLSVNTFTAIE